MNSLVVEFAGLPGAGKSTVANQVAKTLVHHQLCVASTPSGEAPGPRGRTRLFYLRFFAERPMFAFSSCAAILRSRQQSSNDLFWTTATWLKRAARLARARANPGIHLLDPGISQALWSVGYSARNPSLAPLVSSLLARAPLPHLVVVLEADDETLLSRLAQRPGKTSRLERQGKTGLATARRALDEVLAGLARLKGASPELLTLAHGRGSNPETCAAEVVRWIEAKR